MKQKTIEKVDVHNDAVMVSIGIRPKHAEDRDPNVWNKTDREKAQLSIQRKVHKYKWHFGTTKNTIIPVKDKLIIQLKKNNKFANTTYSIVCYMHQISQIIAFFNKELVAKYTFNGKTYKANELPFWGTL